MSKSDDFKTDPSAVMQGQSGTEDEEDQRGLGYDLEKIISGAENLRISEQEPTARQDSITPPSPKHTLSTQKRNDPSVKFVINVPVEVTPTMSMGNEAHCQQFLKCLRNTAFREGDELRYNDIAVVFGLNAKKSHKHLIESEFNKEFTHEIYFEKIWFEWEEEEEEEEKEEEEEEEEEKRNKRVPYRKIRETIKSHEDTKKLVRRFREKDPEVKIYFCFFDADTVDFKQVLSSYIDVIREKNYPTVMSTGYLLPENSKFRKESIHDRRVRIITAQHFPLGTYYPETNLCVLLPDGEETLPESFTNRKDGKNNMESAVLITQVKIRKGFTIVFADENPIITCPSHNKQFHFNKRTWAISAYAHKELKVSEEYKKKITEEKKNQKQQSEDKQDRRIINGLHTSLLMGMLTSEAKAKEIEDESCFEGAGAVDRAVFKAAEAVRPYLNNSEN